MRRRAQRVAYEAGGLGATIGRQWGPGAKPLGGGPGGAARHGPKPASASASRSRLF